MTQHSVPYVGQRREGKYLNNPIIYFYSSYVYRQPVPSTNDTSAMRFHLFIFSLLFVDALATTQTITNVQCPAGQYIGLAMNVYEVTAMKDRKLNGYSPFWSPTLISTMTAPNGFTSSSRNKKCLVTCNSIRDSNNDIQYFKPELTAAIQITTNGDEYCHCNVGGYSYYQPGPKNTINTLLYDTANYNQDYVLDTSYFSSWENQAGYTSEQWIWLFGAAHSCYACNYWTYQWTNNLHRFCVDYLAQNPEPRYAYFRGTDKSPVAYTWCQNGYYPSGRSMTSDGTCVADSTCGPGTWWTVSQYSTQYEKTPSVYGCVTVPAGGYKAGNNHDGYSACPSFTYSWCRIRRQPAS